MARNTSITDDGIYPEFCYIAAKHDEVFQNFKRHQIYTQILEHVTPDQGKQYLEIILSNPDLKLNAENWDAVLKNDSVGNPRVVTYNVGNAQLTCSPTTLRYMKVFSDIVTLFDTEKIKSVAEVGIGYAGQCRILMSLLQIKKYNLIDLPEVLALAERFLTELNSNGGGVRYIDGTHLYNDIESDLFISNYAFSELNRQVQNMYIEKVLSKAKAGYITWNNLSADMMNAYTLEEILSIIPDAKIIPERPLTFAKNCIIVWGTK